VAAIQAAAVAEVVTRVAAVAAAMSVEVDFQAAGAQAWLLPEGVRAGFVHQWRPVPVLPVRVAP
jgi:hypothetical protein